MTFKKYFSSAPVPSGRLGDVDGEAKESRYMLVSTCFNFLWIISGSSRIRVPPDVSYRKCEMKHDYSPMHQRTELLAICIELSFVESGEGQPFSLGRY